jgi:rare lipoprotein A
MRRVAGVFPLKVRPVTFVAALVLAGACVLAALYVADRIVSSDQEVSSNQQPVLRTAKITPPRPSEHPTNQSEHRRTASPGPSDAGKQVVLATPIAIKPTAPVAVEPKPPEAREEAPAETGRASWYDLDSETASGEVMDGDGLTAAHRTLPLGTKVRVENLDNGRAVVVRVNDRGPFAKDRIIDLSKAAAEQLDMIEAGVARVSVSPVGDLVASKASGDAPPLDR